VESDLELVCPRVIDAERPSPGTSASVNRNILHLPRLVYKRERKRKLVCASLAPFKFPQFSLFLFL
jgi:hypothetical protein